jgi:hypothetical protein
VSLQRVLKHVSGDKSRAEMTLAELNAAVGWPERNHLSEHCICLTARRT